MNLDYFLKVEKKYDLLNKEVDGYAFWVYARNGIAWKYEQAMEHLNEAHSQGSKAKTFNAYKTFTQIWNVIWHGRRPKSQTDFLVINHPRRVFIDKYYECLYTSEIIEKLSSVFVLESPYQDMHYTPIKEKNYRYTDRIALEAKAYCAITQLLCRRKFYALKNQMKNNIEKAVVDLNRVYNVSLDSEMFANMFIYGYLIYKITKKRYEQIIKRVKPKAIIEVVSYSTECMIMNEVAYEMTIPTIELQHGVIGSAHTAYNYPSIADTKQFPQYLFLFSDFWKKSDRFPIPQSHILAMGYPYMERQAKKYAPLRQNKSHITNILFLSSGPIGRQLVDIAVELNQLLNNQKYHIIYKLHPGEYAVWKQNYPILADSNIEVIDNNKINLYELFSKSDIQVGAYNSTTVFEGLYFELDTYILRYCACKEFDELCQDGIARYFDATKELAELLEAPHTNIGGRSIAFWKENALENMLNKLNDIVNEASCGENR